MARNQIVFLSSTSDLDDCRREVESAVRRLRGWDCDQMDWFGACDEEPEELCRRRVSECDVFVGIVGYTYGSMPDGKDKSFCEIEYDVAEAGNIPRLMFLASDKFLQPAKLLSEKLHFDRQRQFRERLLPKRLADEFASASELSLKVVTSIYHWEKERQSELLDAPREQQDTVDRAIRNSLSLTPDAPIPEQRRKELTGLDLSAQSDFGDAGMPLVAALTNLQGLSVAGTQVSDSGLAHIRTLAGLQSLGLNATKVTDAGLPVLAQLPNLQYLWLNNTRLGDAGTDDLARLRTLLWLDISATGITDKGLSRLLRSDGSEGLPMPDLHTLGLADMQITNLGLQALSGRDKLRVLSLWGDRAIDDDGMQYLSHLANLEKLHLNATQVSDAGLAHLTGLCSLRELDLRGTRVTQQGIQKLWEALEPSCLILSDHAVPEGWHRPPKEMSS